MLISIATFDIHAIYTIIFHFCMFRMVGGVKRCIYFPLVRLFLSTKTATDSTCCAHHLLVGGVHQAGSTTLQHGTGICRLNNSIIYNILI